MTISQEQVAVRVVVTFRGRAFSHSAVGEIDGQGGDLALGMLRGTAKTVEAELIDFIVDTGSADRKAAFDAWWDARKP
jgi:hypothetical protein